MCSLIIAALAEMSLLSLSPFLNLLAFMILFVILLEKNPLVFPVSQCAILNVFTLQFLMICAPNARSSCLAVKVVMFRPPCAKHCYMKKTARKRKKEVMKNAIRLYSLRDDKVNEFAPPVAVHSDALAIRQFGDLISTAKPDSLYSLHREDFSLWYVGDFDLNTGAFTPATAVKLASGADFAKA